MSDKKPTISTIAKLTGLSLATVSRALAGADSVLPPTRDRVLQVAKEINYVRDRAAVRLKTGKTYVVAFLMNRLDANQPAFKDLLLGVSDALSDTDYHMIVLPESIDGDGLETLRYVVDRGLADAMVITHTKPKDPRVQYLLDKNFAFATHGRTRMGHNKAICDGFGHAHPFVDFANEQYAQLAVDALVARGRKKLAILLPREGGTFRLHLVEGFMQACEHAKVHGVTVPNLDMDGSAEHIYTWAAQQACEFDGLIVTRESPLVALLGGLSDAKLKLGHHLDLVTKYSTSWPVYLRQPLLGCFEDIELTGRTIAQRLLHQLDPANHALPATYLFTPPAIESIHDHS